VTIIEIIYLKNKSLRSPKSSIIPALLGGLVPYPPLELLTLPYISPRHIPFLPYLNNIPLYNEKEKKMGERSGEEVGKRRGERKGHVSCYLLFLFQI
jgi:hypothetical protein